MNGPGRGYTAHDVARWIAEPPKRSGRGPFQRDHARVVHSAALRRLAAKTQVVGPETDDFVRNRLTHTLEVAQIGRELARALGCDPDLVETACLAHDLGHPPFGHNGERALDEVTAHIGGFEGNAQTLRILTRLEPKTLEPKTLGSDGPDQRSAGLNLTRAALDAATKYPWPRPESAGPHGVHADGSPRRLRKFGVYPDDAEVFGWMRDHAPPLRTSIEAQVMDLADDIAYSVHDVEDGIAAGRIELTRLRDATERKAVVAAVLDWYLPQSSEDELEAALGRLQRCEGWPESAYDGSRRAQAALKNLTSRLIGQFCQSVEDATHRRHGAGPLVRYAADLEVPQQTRAEIAVLKGIAAHYIMRADDRVDVLREQREVVADLVRSFVQTPERLEPAFRGDYGSAATDGERLRVVVDQVASLTDASALAWHRDFIG
ncbi:MAG: deoxyguanosinetriphosphate triphosphohydrolase [Propionibacteriales bacterium]|nr:deoxyguanosinetriphosphate triphosphohydrolase [Propionibacteriales bacterium]